MLTTSSLPIVLHHGLLGLTNFQLGPVKMSYFGGIDDALVAAGHEPIVTKVHPTASIEQRAAELKESMLAQLGNRRAIVLAHSMGGLDARHMLAHLGMADRVAALVTISTPHRGSAYADWVLKHVGHRLGGLKLAEQVGLNVEALHNLTLDHCAGFNARTPDAPGVRYYSVSAAKPWFGVPPWALHAWRVIDNVEGPNDGLVSVKSAAWATHLATWKADHWHTVNKKFAIGAGDIVPEYLDVVQRVTRDVNGSA